MFRPQCSQSILRPAGLDRFRTSPDEGSTSVRETRISSPVLFRSAAHATKFLVDRLEKGGPTRSAWMVTSKAKCRAAVDVRRGEITMRSWLAELVASDFGCLAISKHFGSNGQPTLRAKPHLDRLTDPREA
jgi:hypothetical protein